jgi:carbon-monoxide dehydrogenase small subunit
MTQPRAIALDINGEVRDVAVRPSDTLLETLRDNLALTGAKRGCNQGVCGACTVMVDGLAARSCLLLSVACTERKILTIEGLMRDGALDPVQEAFVAAGAVQCGFCMPGMVMAARALLDVKPRPGIEEIREAIGENVCRCSGYVKIVDAIRMVGRS